MSPSDDYDVIVVGAGSSGAVVAARLSEDPGRRVLLVEAGPHYPATGTTPADLLDANTMSLVDHSWGFTAQLTQRRRVMFPLAKVTGGSSAVGNTVAIRGTPQDYDEWAANGNPLWSWEHVLPFFRTLEDDLEFGDRDYHGRGGPVPIRRWRPDELTPLQQEFRDASLGAGHQWADDHNDPASTGVGPIPTNRRDMGIRHSTAMSYLWPAAGRPNLTVVGRAGVDRVIFEGERAAGVSLAVDGGTFTTIRARRVILAAGAVGTPAILLRSGIGPADDLRGLGIPVRVDLPGVGAGLTDQPRIGVFMTPKPGNENEGKSTGQIVTRTSGERFNDLYYAAVNRFDLTHHFPELRRVAGATAVFGVMVVLRRQHSRGRVSLASANPYIAPAVDLGYLSDERDYGLLAEGVRGCWELASSPKILDKGEQLVAVDERIMDDAEALRGYISSAVDSAYNPVGTARMGPADDVWAVVDQRCGVHGVENLHVADASIMPSMVCANTHLSVVMIGERAAALLRDS
ncbi:GMC family oxidoreductase [Actinoplanes capillaceus]|uniref:GMC family oxidoreductase n=1 Tax=Actinoplanes campanulatus TaxID=113559 RepID=A0ABQ3WSM9_9ACTN|nr:GMC family oxidoreductase N-terminal domain-containing protein [Actinoplanes capillaceus]GID49217.1 GMC family oxidoreductase [Actinoplanes capillaceus]